ncbi:hypothetical protein EVB68_014 [Rhizobium phage RHph_Y2_6]|uniref:Transmembrane protein n=1 Tax=Rhizobium phage RHph_Y2_6 TaxID=2509576 RepID=A0A7S5UTY6_9CAUD|nr:hypothetical protein PP748_gp014 [Rhizobium phage RHph_Y2_6]QIG68751.1 hypothetical protein EVB68_014 [Rhizobium phage RHph_Y2_6]
MEFLGFSLLIFTIVILIMHWAMNPWRWILTRDEQRFAWSLQIIYLITVFAMLVLAIKNS